jgi:hypothetical protein
LRSTVASGTQSSLFHHEVSRESPVWDSRRGKLSVPPVDFPGDFLFYEMHSAEIVIIGQLQDVAFVFLKILIGCGDAQITDYAGGWKSASLGQYSIIR